MKLHLGTFVANADVLRRNPGNRNILTPEPGLLPEHAAGATLAGQAVAHGNAHGIANDFGGELAATACGESGCHGDAFMKWIPWTLVEVPKPYINSGWLKQMLLLEG